MKGMWLLAGVTFLALSAWSGSARTGGASSAVAVVNEVQMVASPMTLPVAPEDDTVNLGGGAQSLPLETTDVVAESDGSVGNVAPPIAPIRNPNADAGDISYAGGIPVWPVPVFDMNGAPVRGELRTAVPGIL